VKSETASAKQLYGSDKMHWQAAQTSYEVRMNWNKEQWGPLTCFWTTNAGIGRSQWPSYLRQGIRQIACWDWGFQSLRSHGFLSLSPVIACCQVEDYATSRSLVQRSPTGFGVSLCVIEKLQQKGGPGPCPAVVSRKKNAGTDNQIA
jgi:hypothetical protein